MPINIVYIAAGILFSASAQICMKLATRYELERFWWLLLISGSLLSYALSFVMYYMALRYFPISRVSPIMTIGVVLLVVLFGFFSGELITHRQALGILIGVVSIILIIS